MSYATELEEMREHYEKYGHPMPIANHYEQRALSELNDTWSLVSVGIFIAGIITGIGIGAML